jgi:hypothetical protein
VRGWAAEPDATESTPVTQHGQQPRPRSLSGPPRPSSSRANRPDPDLTLTLNLKPTGGRGLFVLGGGRAE